MTRKKKGIIILCILLVICLLTGTVAVVVQRINASAVTVVPVDSIFMESYAETTNVEGNVSTSATQKVKLSDDTSILEVYVQEGDQVHKGDNLLTFDMTLTELELSIAQLTRRSQQLQLEEAQERLESLENGGPIENEDETPARDSGVESEEINETDGVVDDDAEVIEEANAGIIDPGFITASWNLRSPFYLTAATETKEEDSVDTEKEETEKSSSSSETEATPSAEPLQDEEPEEESEPTQIPVPESDSPEELGDETLQEEEETDLGTSYTEKVLVPRVDAEKAKMITRLTASSIAFSGDGSEENPFTYICETGISQVRVTKGFLNLMMGYSPDGMTRYEQVKPYYFQLIFYTNGSLGVIQVDAAEDYKDISFPLTEDSKDPEITYQAEDSKEGSVDNLEELSGALDNALNSEENNSSYADEYEENPGYYSGEETEEDGETPTITREEAIENKKSDIKNLELDIRESDIDISKLQKKLDNRTVTSTVNGTVTKMGDPETGSYSGDAFMEVVSDQGLYVTGAVSELLLGEFQEGMVLSGTSYESGDFFKATVTEVADYPIDGAQYSYGNPNVSYYPFIAEVEGDVDLDTDEYISLSFEKENAGNIISIIKAFVRSENGQNYVLIDENGKLKKQYVAVGVSTDGYSIPIKSGLSMEDKIAFPYGKGVKEGAKTQEGTLDDVYGY